MELLKKIVGLYVSTSVHVALAVVSLGLVSVLEYGGSIDLNLFIFIFLGSITGYNFVKYAGVAKLHHLSLTANLRFIQIFSLLCFLLLVYFAFKQEKYVIYVAGAMGVLTALYAVPLFKGKTNLRSVEGLKIFVIAFVWAGVSVLMPLITVKDVSVTDLLLSFIQRLLFVVALTLPFEIRDVRFDEISLGTIPQQLGVKNTKRLGFILLSGMCFLEIFKSDFKPVTWWSLLLIAILTGIFIKKSRKHQHEFYASFWLEAVPIFWLGIWLFIDFLYWRVHF